MLTKHIIVQHFSDPISDKMQNFIGSKKIEEDEQCNEFMSQLVELPLSEKGTPHFL